MGFCFYLILGDPKSGALIFQTKKIIYRNEHVCGCLCEQFGAPKKKYDSYHSLLLAVKKITDQKNIQTKEAKRKRGENPTVEDRGEMPSSIL